MKSKPENPERELLATARKVATLLTRRRKLRRQLKATETELRHERKMLKALASARTQSVGSRLFGDGVGYQCPPADLDEFLQPASPATAAFVDALVLSDDELAARQRELKAR